MDPEHLLHELLGIARRNGLEVRTRAISGTHAGAGGLCRILGRPVVLLNARSSALERSAALAQALRRLRLEPGTAGVDVRMFLASQSGQDLLLPMQRPGPGLAKTKPEN